MKPVRGDSSSPERPPSNPAVSSRQSDGKPDARFPHRLSNTALTLGQLAGRETGLILENALLDTASPITLPIPESLSAQGDPGAYIVQSRGLVTESFRQVLRNSGAKIIGYIPNNAFLVRADTACARALTTHEEIQAVVPYEPYFKLKPALLAIALGGVGVTEPENSTSPLPLRALLFQDGRNEVLNALQGMGAEFLAEEGSPFGPVVRLRLPAKQLVRLAALAGVQEVELASARMTANDLNRPALGVAVDATTTNSYLGLTGKGVVVNVNDTGVDINQADLLGRVLVNTPRSGTDTNGHGTHVAGIVAGSGAQSLTVSNAPGSVTPSSKGQFRGVAPQASIYSMAVDLNSGPGSGDAGLQQTIAGTNAFISNNSWVYSGQYDYDLAAASYDAAVRDALPGTPGSQPLLFVFAAGNAGAGVEDGTGGIAGSIQSPATAKNVITVGAVEHLRLISNQTWTCSGTLCETNTPWLGMTDSSNEVAAFSSRGNVGLGREGELGRFKPDVVAPGTFIVSTRSGEWDQLAYYSQSNNLLYPNPDANSSEVLSNLNTGIGPFYRFESGTSLAAAAVSGTLALMQEFFEQRLGRTNSPVLMKALLINGARPLGLAYDFHSSTNSQGWGLVNLPSSIPPGLTNLNAASNSMWMFDQDVKEALVTGQSRTRFICVSSAGRSQPLRVTLAWTDPPGDPVAGIKLVNDLDLIVTNLDTGDVYYGNDFPAGQSSTRAWDANSAPNRDFVNNVENVYLAPGGTNFSVTVLGLRVSVSARSDDPLRTAQDYALVISSGDGQVRDALTLSDGPTPAPMPASVTWITNTLPSGANAFGDVLSSQRIGANPPTATNTVSLSSPVGASLTIGVTNQWQFYVFTNETAFTNVAFLTFSASALASFPGAGTALREADIDLYVSTNSSLTNLDPAALANADHSAGRGGTETVVYTNATAGVYYVGVKCESQEGAEFGFGALASQMPFNQVDSSGNELLQGLPVPATVPGGTPEQPGLAYLFCLSPDSFPVRRVIVTNTVTCSSLADLSGTLTHDNDSVVLNNFAGGGPLSQQSLVYDDSAEGDVPWGRPSDGPGSLQDFAGGEGFGQWQLTLMDTNRAATDDDLQVFLEQQPDLTAGISPNILPGACRQDYVSVPVSATNLTTVVSFVSGTGPLSVQVCRQGEAWTNAYLLLLTAPGTNGVLILDNTTHPPLNPGTYIVRVCNLGPDVAQVTIAATPALDAGPPALTWFTGDAHASIPDDSVSTSTIHVTNEQRLLSVEVGVRIDHPRVSDLALSLISPRGERVLLSENRGNVSAAGMGVSVLVTNTLPVSYRGGPQAVTNVIETDVTSGVASISYDFLSLPDTMHVYYDGQLLFDSGLKSGTGTTSIAYGPGLGTSLTIVMNEGGNSDSNTAWFYSITTAQLQPVHLTFTEDTNLASLPIKFAPTPFTNFNYTGSGYLPGNGIFYLPEESLERFSGESAAGDWKLEIIDRRAGATNPAPMLVSWRLGLRFLRTVPLPVVISAGNPSTNLIGAGQIQWYAIDAPEWVSYATNSLLFASAPVDLWFNQTAPPTGTNAGDIRLLANSSAGFRVLQTNIAPQFLPGARYYLGVQNTNAFGVGFALQADFDVENIITLQGGGGYASTNSGPAGAVDYYRFVVSTNAVRAQFEINGPTANLELVARRGLPLPTAASFDYLSANPGTNDQLIVLYDYSKPVALSPGEWFLGVINNTGAPAGYSIMATEFTAYGTNIVITEEVITSTNACLTWSSLPGAHYYIEGKMTLNDTNWVALSPTLTAGDVFTSYCLDLPSSYAFFRVQEGLVITPPPLLISSIDYVPQGVLLQWSASTNLEFRVQWSPGIAPPQWNFFTNRVSSTTGTFSFLDDGTQSGGVHAPRFYRLVQIP